MKLLIISDAWFPQINGVVRTYEHLSEELRNMGHEVKVIGPADFPDAYTHAWLPRNQNSLLPPIVV